MTKRRLSTEEQALWARVIASVTPITPHKRPVYEESVAIPVTKPVKPTKLSQPKTVPVTAQLAKPAPAIGTTLDGSWDRKLTRGAIYPDISVDLHGHTLGSAYTLLDTSLARAIASDVRVILLVTGKPPAKDRDPHKPGRGAIRAAVGDWLAASRHARHIASVRNAHPRHGGQGALYIILRRAERMAGSGY